jgi:hypothetical protein
MSYISVDCINCVSDELRGSLPALYSTGGKVTDLRSLVPIGYNNCIYMGYEIYPNRQVPLIIKLVSVYPAWYANQLGDPHNLS